MQNEKKIAAVALSVEGGIPLITDDKIVGGIGVRGNSSDHDAMCATVAAEAIK
jgi:uncharacterized protein GlcG (DUF336 family)